MSCINLHTHSLTHQTVGYSLSQCIAADSPTATATGQSSQPFLRSFTSAIDFVFRALTLLTGLQKNQEKNSRHKRPILKYLKHFLDDNKDDNNVV